MVPLTPLRYIILGFLDLEDDSTKYKTLKQIETRVKKSKLYIDHPDRVESTINGLVAGGYAELHKKKYVLTEKGEKRLIETYKFFANNY